MTSGTFDVWVKLKLKKTKQMGRFRFKLERFRVVMEALLRLADGEVRVMEGSSRQANRRGRRECGAS